MLTYILITLAVIIVLFLTFIAVKSPDFKVTRSTTATNETLFTFKPQGNQTLMTWDMTGRHNFISKIFCTFMNMDKMVGGQFEQGLAKLKGVVEQPAART